ncbi:MAG TPA: protease pro-enzyme activation domain-containing protein, partial [Lapillicoccus sp.]
MAVLGVAAVSCALVGATSSSAVAAPGNGRRALAGSVPSWAQAAHKVGASDKNTQVDFRVYLNNGGGEAAAQLATAVSTPGNAQYGKFLTPAQYRARFAPTQAEVDSVSAWLRSQGFKVGYVPDNHKYVEAVGSVAQASTAFGTSFSHYTVQGKTLRSNDTQLAVPNSSRTASTTTSSALAAPVWPRRCTTACSPSWSRRPVTPSAWPTRHCTRRGPCRTTSPRRRSRST